MERIVNIGIIGCGGIANGKHMPSLSTVPNVRMVAFCDIVPERAEAGTLPTPAIAGLLAGIREVQTRGIGTIAAQDKHLYDRARAMLGRFSGTHVYAPHCRGPVLLFSHDRIPADALGAELDKHGICVRAGFHCAALGHATLHTPDTGAVRLSFGMDTTPSDLDALYSALKEILL